MTSQIVRPLMVHRRIRPLLWIVALTGLTGCMGGIDDPGIDLNGPAIAVVTVTPVTVSLKVGAMQQFTVGFQPALPDSTVAWTVADTITATVDATGRLFARSPGKTRVTVVSVLNLNTKGTAQVTVTQ